MSHSNAESGHPGSVFVETFLAGVREYARTPVLLALLGFLPAYFILTFAFLVPETTGQLSVPGDGQLVVTMNDVYAVSMTPMVGALVGGIAGLFVMQGARDTDARFVVAGAPPLRVLLARFGLLAVVGLLVAVVSTGVLALTYVPERPAVVLIAVFLAALAYGLVGVLAGQVLNRLAGVYVLLFGSMLDMFILQNPFADAPAGARFLPGHAPMELVVDAGFSTSVAVSSAVESAVIVLGLGAVAALSLHHSMQLS